MCLLARLLVSITGVQPYARECPGLVPWACAGWCARCRAGGEAHSHRRYACTAVGRTPGTGHMLGAN